MIFFAHQVFVPDEKGDLTFQADAIQDLSSSAASSGDLGVAFFKMLLTFGALILLLFGTYWFLKRMIRQRALRGSGTNEIRVLERKMLSPKTMLYLVEVENKKILIAESHLEVRRLDVTPQKEDNP